MLLYRLRSSMKIHCLFMVYGFGAYWRQLFWYQRRVQPGLIPSTPMCATNGNFGPCWCLWRPSWVHRRDRETLGVDLLHRACSDHRLFLASINVCHENWNRVTWNPLSPSVLDSAWPDCRSLPQWTFNLCMQTNQCTQTPVLYEKLS